MTETKRHILIRLPNWIGDAVMAAPTILGLAEREPDAAWHLLGPASTLALFEGLEEPFLLEPPVEARGSRWKRVLREARALRGRFDAALILPPSFSSALSISLAQAPERVGWPSDGRRALLTSARRRPTRSRALRAQYAELGDDLLERLGSRAHGALDPATRRLPLRPEEMAWAETWFKAASMDPARAVALAPGALFGATKRWPEAHWQDLARGLTAARYSVIWIGGPEERELCERLAAAAPESRSLAGRMSLRETLALLARVRLVVSNDSGAMHLADAAGSPVLGIFGSTSPEWTGPGGPHSRFVTRRQFCSPCFRSTCPTEIECLRDLEPRAVLDEAHAMLEQPIAPTGGGAVFLDRDGTLLELVSYLSKPEEVRLAPRAVEALSRFRARGLRLVVVTNQSIVARGGLDRAGLERVHARVRELLAEAALSLDSIETCPHHPEFTGPCACRKPAPGLVRRAAHRFDLDLGKSLLIGDGAGDIGAARAAGVSSVLVRTGYGRETESALAGAPRDQRPDAVVDDLLGAADWWIDTSS